MIKSFLCPLFATTVGHSSNRKNIGVGVGIGIGIEGDRGGSSIRHASAGANRTQHRHCADAQLPT